ncbi:hypothetical protein B0H19DRAFT_106931 [Mycena capillaripes]|nr:hypothetical protein B0H19DRAFT_106931 [Mycena capillaripes]
MWHPFSIKALVPLLLLISCTVRESMRDGRRPSTPASRLLIDLTQIALSLVLNFLAKRKILNSILLGDREKDDFTAIEGHYSSDAIIPAGTRRFYALGGVIGALFAIQAFTVCTIKHLIIG